MVKKYFESLGNKLNDLIYLLFKYKELNLDENNLNGFNDILITIIQSCNKLLFSDKINFAEYNQIINEIDKFCCQIRNEISCYYCVTLLTIMRRYSNEVIIKVIPTYYSEVKPILEETLNEKSKYNSIDRFRYLKNIYDDIERKISSLDELQRQENKIIEGRKLKDFWLQIFVPIMVGVVSVVSAVLIAIIN